MSWRGDARTTAETLRRAWAAADEQASAALSAPVDDERIWRAVAGELPPAELQQLVEAAARDPEVARSWRLARELQATMPGRRPGTLLRFPAGAPALRWAAVAALLALVVGTGLWMRPGPLRGGGGESPLRGGEPTLKISPLVNESAGLSRHDLVLRWTALPDPETRYTLRLTTADLTVIAEARDLSQPNHRVAPEALAAVPAGTTLLWQVDGRLPDGRVVSSATARVVLRD